MSRPGVIRSSSGARNFHRRSATNDSMHRAVLPAALLAALLLGGPALAAPVRTPHVEAELVAERTAVAPGEPLTVALRLKMIPEWHTYWRNPGDSGEPTRLEWRLPAGLRGERDPLAVSEPPARRPAHELRVRRGGPAPLAHHAAARARARDAGHARRESELARLQPRALHPGGRGGVARRSRSNRARSRTRSGRSRSPPPAPPCPRRRRPSPAGRSPRAAKPGASRSPWSRPRTPRCASSSSSRSSRARSSRPRRSRSRARTTRLTG